MLRNEKLVIYLISVIALSYFLIDSYCNKYDQPFYFYQSFGRISEQEGRYELIDMMKKEIDSNEYKNLLTILLLQHANIGDHIIARNIIKKDSILELFPIIESSKIFYQSTQNIHWSVGFPLSGNIGY